MPITRSAKEAIRNSARKRVFNDRRRNAMKSLTKEAKIAPSQDGLNKAYQAIDKAVKKGVIKPNAGARKKSQVARALAKAAPAKK
jgi:small subunit ribosomal protein S20